MSDQEQWLGSDKEWVLELDLGWELWLPSFASG